MVNMKKAELLRHWWNLYKIDILIVAGLLLLAGIPRLFDLGTFLTADEKNWIVRSYEFVRAFKDFRFNDMLQTTHPGVTTLWSAGVTIVASVFLRHIPFSTANLRHFVWPAQLPVAFLNTLAVAAMYVFLRKLLPGRWLPFFATAWVALDPFIIGYSRVAHVDALLMSFLWLAALAVMVYVKELYDHRYLLVSAVLAAAALLTKIPAIFIIPFFLLAILVYRLDFIRHGSFIRHRVRDLVEWLLIIGVLVMAVWPALLFVPNPQGNVLQLKRDFVSAAVTPHNAVEDYTLNPLHYPAALLTRTTPLTLVFSILLVVMLAWEFLNRWLKRAPKQSFLFSLDRRTLLLFVAYVFFFIVMMTLGAKKGDRYILPVWPALDMFAAIGLMAVAQKVATSVKGFKKSHMIFAIGFMALLYFAFVVWRYHPYEIAYSSPIFPDNLSQELGWGEGLDQVGAWLTEHDPQAVVASWYPEELAAFTSAHVAHINAHQQNQVQYVVLYRNMFGREPSHYANDFIDEYYKKKDPVFVAHIAGKEFAWVYAKRSYERIVGELLPGITVTQIIEPTFSDFIGIEVQPATYSGKAEGGYLRINLVDVDSGQVVGNWRTAVSQLTDNEWQRFLLNKPISLGDVKLRVEISGEDTTAGRAPTIRYTSAHDYRVGDFVSGGKQRQGDIAVRMLYKRGDQFVAEEDSKLLR